MGCCLPNIIGMITAMMIRWVKYVSWLGHTEMHIRFQPDNLNAITFFFLSPNIIAISPRKFSDRVWRSQLMACRKYIHWCISYIRLNHIDWVWFLIHEVFEITHNDAPQSVGLLWTSDQFVAETSTWQHKTVTTDKHPCPRWDSNPQSQQASGRRPTA